MTIEYRIELTPDDNGTLLVTCPQLQAVTTFGADEADAHRHALDAIEVVLAVMMDDDDDIPKPDGSGDAAVRLPLLAALKLELYWTLKDLALSRAELAHRLDTNRKAVDQLLSLDRQSSLQDFEAAFAVLGRQIDVDVRKAA